MIGESHMSQSDMSKSIMNQSDTSKSSMSQSDTSKSIMSQSDTSKFSMSQLDTSKSIMSQLDMSQSDTSPSIMSQSDMSKSIMSLSDTYKNTKQGILAAIVAATAVAVAVAVAILILIIMQIWLRRLPRLTVMRNSTTLSTRSLKKTWNSLQKKPNVLKKRRIMKLISPTNKHFKLNRGPTRLKQEPMTSKQKLSKLSLVWKDSISRRTWLKRGIALSAKSGTTSRRLVRVTRIIF